jgi:metallophosphoesterase (TIGR00282 family)
LQNNIQIFSYADSSFFIDFPKVINTYNEDSIKILMVGDVMGRPGRQILKKILPQFKTALGLDFVTINGENLAGGFGITEKIYDELMDIGVDVFTMGNHWKDKHDIHLLRRKYKNIVLPHNLIGVSDIDKAPTFYLSHKKVTINVINLMGNFAMKDNYKSPFEFLLHEKDNFMDKIKSGSHIMIADIHAEASSEKQAIAWMYDGILAGLIGTHTHTPTSDERLTDLGTAFISDVGMTGAYNSVIGMEKENVIRKLALGAKGPHVVAAGDIWFCGFLLEVNPKTNLSIGCTRVQCRSSLDGERWLLSRVSTSPSRT